MERRQHPRVDYSPATPPAALRRGPKHSSRSFTPPLYFDWLQRDNPTGSVDRLPELADTGETSAAGVYCVGDLTGVPLVKLAAESGHAIVERFAADPTFATQRAAAGSAVLDLAIVGAGPAGVAAGLRAQELGYRFVILEASRAFNTLTNFPAGKPIAVTPPGPVRSRLAFADGTKETLLAELAATLTGANLPIREGEMAERVVRDDGFLTVKTGIADYRALRVIVAIGRTGATRLLDVRGGSLPKVFTRLIDPGVHRGQTALVVGGGDSALEAAVALARSGAAVTLSYRKSELARPKAHNLSAFEREVAAGAIRPLLGSVVKEIAERNVTLDTQSGPCVIDNDAVYALIGAEPPVAFFRRSGIRVAGERRAADWLKCAVAVSFAAMLYFGKKAPATPVSAFGDFFAFPAKLAGGGWAAGNAIGACIAFVALVVSASVLTVQVVRRIPEHTRAPWRAFTHVYLGAIVVGFAGLYVSHNLLGRGSFAWDPAFWYPAAYSLTVVIFGLRRMRAHPTGYVRRQTMTLIAVQVLPLFVLPVFVLPFLGTRGLLGSWVMAHVFPGESYWRAYGFVLAWPLFMQNVATGEPSAFWLAVALVQTFGLIPWIVYRWGKGAYCGWICSCGALAETLGDAYRVRALHGRAAKRAENAAQVVLWFALAVTVLALTKGPAGNAATTIYGELVDIVLAGVLGLGLYFVMSGRVWCRFFCPLAAIMHLYARFSRFRIFADHTHCISCAICTRVCHMGIDVMGYANKGIPLNDVQCVRCSACIESCPMDVLSFGQTR